MYFGDGKLPTWNFNESLSSSFPRDSFETFSFDSGSIGRLFPTSALDRFKHTPLRRLSSGDIYNSTGSVVRNIPIKIERAKNGYDISRDDGSSERFSSANHPNRRESSAPPESFVTLRVPIS
ncbi:unnamed protein product [Dracunculus medinensis]|uniref:Ovule protein n=1 Tax=Dracunculus medinensis TaxID=318479 RepID=A0A0N4UB13_DRAME|nr:unnamed protein product [Dracunculus medinensis]